MNKGSKVAVAAISGGAVAAAIIIAVAVYFSTAELAQTPSVNNGSPSPAVEASNSTQDPGSVLKLSRASIPIDIPLEKGYQGGDDIYFIATDVSDEDVAQQITERSGFKVNFAPLLASTPEDARNQAYAFRNGVEGEGPFGFQPVVVDAKPGDEGYSPLWQINLVDWNSDVEPAELTSVQEVLDAERDGDLSITETEIIANHPAIRWNGGELLIREDRDDIHDDSSYMGGQVLNIDTENMVVSMVAHRGWGPDGKTIYYIVTDATPDMPAEMMGVPFVPADEKLAATPVAVDLFQFTNGIVGSGPMGFQAGIGAANPDDSARYSPMWKIFFIEWNDPAQARVLENMGDINEMTEAGLVTLTPAEGGLHVVNCPFFDEETVTRHMSS